VGSVWSAIDAAGAALTVAVLDAAVASDQRWRDAFAAAANGLAPPQAGAQSYLHADFAAAAPWVACTAGDGPGAERVFVALGMDYRPVPPQVAAAPAQPAPVRPDPGHMGAEPTLGMDVASRPAVDAFADTPADPASAPPYPVSGPPQPVPAPPQSVSAPPQIISPEMAQYGGGPVSPGAPSPHDPLYWPPAGTDPGQPAAGRRIAPSEPAPRRTGLWIGAAALAVVVLIGGGSFFAWRAFGGSEPPRNTPTTGAAPAPHPVPAPTTSPLLPGLEPPRPGTWPAKWPTFGSKDKVRTVTLEGVGFPLTTPETWDCVRSGNAEGFVRYNCGASLGTNVQLGGELIVRNCPGPCDEKQRDQMRKAEEAWGAQWRSGGRYATLAETTKIDGAPRYGLVVVGYWRSTPEAVADRQVVLRMTAPTEWVDEIRKVANGVRTRVNF
jgi:hypothetical protein